jgi:lysozyme
VKINAAGIALIKRFEGLRLQAYQCPAGIWTIGYGHTGT